jgi:hypothetical protein
MTCLGCAGEELKADKLQNYPLRGECENAAPLHDVADAPHQSAVHHTAPMGNVSLVEMSPPSLTRSSSASGMAAARRYESLSVARSGAKFDWSDELER